MLIDYLQTFFVRQKTKFIRRMNPPHVLNERERKASYIIRVLIRDINSELLIQPITNKRFITNESRGMFVIMENASLMLASNREGYYYDLRVNEQVTKSLCNHFDVVLEKRIFDIEQEIIKDLTSNLDFISKNMYAEKEDVSTISLFKKNV